MRLLLLFTTANDVEKKIFFDNFYCFGDMKLCTHVPVALECECIQHERENSKEC